MAERKKKEQESAEAISGLKNEIESFKMERETFVRDFRSKNLVKCNNSDIFRF